MTGVKFGVGLFPTEPLQRMLTLVKLSEDMGFSCAYMGDSQMIWREPYVIMGAAAMVTKKITLATGVTNPITRDLGVLAEGVIEGRRTFAHTLKYVLMATSSNFGNMCSAAPTTAAVIGITIMGRLGRLRKKGIRRVRMRKITSVWVARDSTNQPLRNSLWLAWRISSITKNVAKSKTELRGPNTLMKRRTKAMSQAAGRARTSGSTASVGMASWPMS